MFENYTIAISGFNIKPFAVLSAESFLLLYPDLRPNMVYFDDHSTDGTREELEEREIRVISWSCKHEDLLKSLVESNYFQSETQYLSTRVCLIMRDLMEQVKSKYLLIADGDVIFLQGGFLELFTGFFAGGKRIIAHCENIVFPVDNPFPNIALRNCADWNYYNRFVTRDSEFYYSPRVHMMFCLLDLEYFKSIDLLGDRIRKEMLDVMHGGFVDTGTDFYHQIQDRRIPAHWIGRREMYEILFHFGWLSSSNRITSICNANQSRDILGMIRQKLSEPRLGEILRRTGLGSDEIIQHYQRYQFRPDRRQGGGADPSSGPADPQDCRWTRKGHPPTP